MDDQLTTEVIQSWIARKICMTDVLQVKSEELRSSVIISQRLHFKDLFTFSTRKALKAEQELEISREQIKALEQELHNAYQMLEAAYQEIDACHEEMAKYEAELVASSSLLLANDDGSAKHF